MLGVMLVNGRSEYKAGGVAPRVVHKAGYGTARKGEGTRAVQGSRGAQNGRPEPVAIADHDGPPAVTPPPSTSTRGAGSS